MSEPAPRLRYEPLVKLASGGMATVYVGALRGELAFRQLVAIKRPHPHLVEDPELRDALLAEARLASRIHHANVVDVRDVEVVGDSLQLVMDYVEGASLGQLIALAAKDGPKLPPAVAVRIALDACAGLHAAHELCDEAGAPLGLVHRDVSPQNILVGLDGVARVADFGVAKEAVSARPRTTTGTLKGKIGYLAPEYVRGREVDRRADVFALGVVLWEALATKRLFRASNEAEALERVLRDAAPPVSAYAPGLGTALDAVIDRALAKAPHARYASARDLAEALEAAARPAGLVASHADVAHAVRAAVGDEIEERRKRVREALASLENDAPAPLAPAATNAPALPSSTANGAWPRGRSFVVATAALIVGGIGLATLLVASTRPDRPPAMPSVIASAAPAPAARTSAAPVASLEPAASVAPTASAAATPVPSAEPIATTSASAARPEPPRPGRRMTKPLPPNPYR